MTTVVKHRYLDGGEPGGPCQEDIPGTGPCGLSEFASFHWHDENHPYRRMNDGDSRCAWELRVAGEWCLRGEEVMEHQEAARAAEALAANEGGVWRTRPVRVPDEDGVRVGGNERTASVQLPLTANLAKAFGAKFVGGGDAGAVPSLGERYLRGETVGDGPWAVRQWRLVTVEDERQVSRMARRLLGLGVAWETYVWWDGGVRVTRFVWGEFVGLTEDEAARALDGYR